VTTRHDCFDLLGVSIVLAYYIVESYVVDVETELVHVYDIVPTNPAAANIARTTGGGSKKPKKITGGLLLWEVHLVTGKG